MTSPTQSPVIHTAQDFAVFGTGGGLGLELNNNALGLSFGTGLGIQVHTQPAPAILTPSEDLRSPSQDLALYHIRSHPQLTQSINAALQTISLSGKNRKPPLTSFIHTNESRVEKSLDKIKKWQKNAAAPFQATIKLGVGSIVNYSFAAAAKSSLIIIADIDPNLIKFHKSLISMIENAPNIDSSLVENIITRLEHNELNKRPTHRSLFDTSWITPSNLQTIKEMAQQGRIQCVEANLNDAMKSIEKIKKEMFSQQIKPPKVLLYTSNVGDWIAGRNAKTNDKKHLEADYNEFKLQINKVIGQDGLHVYSSINDKSYSGRYRQHIALSQNGMPDFVQMEPISSRKK